MEAFGLLGNPTDTSHISTNISGPNYDHKSCVEDKLNLIVMIRIVVLVMVLILIVTVAQLRMNL